MLPEKFDLDQFQACFSWIDYLSSWFFGGSVHKNDIFEEKTVFEWIQEIELMKFLKSVNWWL